MLEPLFHSEPSLHNHATAIGRVASAAVIPGSAFTPSQSKLAAVISSHDGEGIPTYPYIAVCIGRRSGKTSTILASVVHRCLSTPYLKVAYCAQTLLKGRDRLLDLQESFTRSGLKGFSFKLGQGSERIVFPNGSVIQFLTPNAEAFRGAAYDVIVLDEAQEHTEANRTELLGGVLPTFDTRPRAQLIVAGTAKRRDCLLWDALCWGRDESSPWAIVEYAADDSEETTDEATWFHRHLGLAEGLTTIDRIRANHLTLPHETFAAEYLGRWPNPDVQAAFDARTWELLGAPMTELPTHFALGMDCSPKGDRVSIVAAWREDGLYRVELLKTINGTGKVVEAVRELSERLPGVVFGYDSAGKTTLDLIDLIHPLNPRPRLKGLLTDDMLKASQKFNRLVLEEGLRHTHQADLTAAVIGAVRRSLGDAAWLFGRRASSVDITALIAAVVAIEVYDSTPIPQPLTLVSSVTSF